MSSKEAENPSYGPLGVALQGVLSRSGLATRCNEKEQCTVPYAKPIAGSFGVNLDVIQALRKGLFSVKLERISPVDLLHVEYVVGGEDRTCLEQLVRLQRREVVQEVR